MRLPASGNCPNGRLESEWVQLGRQTSTLCTHSGPRAVGGDCSGRSWRRWTSGDPGSCRSPNAVQQRLTRYPGLAPPFGRRLPRGGGGRRPAHKGRDAHRPRIQANPALVVARAGNPSCSNARALPTSQGFAMTKQPDSCIRRKVPTRSAKIIFNPPTRRSAMVTSCSRRSEQRTPWFLTRRSSVTWIEPQRQAGPASQNR